MSQKILPSTIVDIITNLLYLIKINLKRENYFVLLLNITEMKLFKTSHKTSYIINLSKNLIHLFRFMIYHNRIYFDIKN